MCFIHSIDFINAQRKVALKLPQFEMLYKGLLFVYLSTSIDRILNGVHVPLSSVPSPTTVTISYFYCIQISNVWGPSWSGSNTPIKMNTKFIFIFCFAVTSLIGWVSIFSFFDSALSIVAWVFWGLTFQSGCALVFWFLWEVKINSIK